MLTAARPAIPAVVQQHADETAYLRATSRVLVQAQHVDMLRLQPKGQVRFVLWYLMMPRVLADGTRLFTPSTINLGSIIKTHSMRPA
jgi:hypothetical protein